MWVWNLASQMKKRAQAENVGEYGAEEDIWTKHGRGNRELDKQA